MKQAITIIKTDNGFVAERVTDLGTQRMVFFTQRKLFKWLRDNLLEIDQRSV